MKLSNIVFEGVDYNDYPDFCDAYISHAEVDGVPLSEIELDKLNDDSEQVRELLNDYLF